MDGQHFGGGPGKRVVVIGGGVAGSLVAKSLQFHSDLTLVDPKEYYEIPWASLRSIVEPSFAERSVIKHRDYLTNGRVVTSSAISFTDNQVLTEEGRLISYDYLVIATGHNDPNPPTRTERLHQYKAENKKIELARTILIVGGGPSGVELAGEISVDFPDKKVILVHEGPRLLDFMGPKASNKTIEWLKSKHVEVKLGQSVIFMNSSSDQAGRNNYQTSTGETIQADCCFLCTGRPVGSEWLKETSLKNSMDGHGRLIVDENMRVKGHKNIFAIGDITNIQEIKQGYASQKHALVAAENLKLLMKGGRENKMASYKPSGSIKLIVSLGRKEAVAQFPYTTTIGVVAGLIKSKDLYVGKTRKQIGLEPHSFNT